MFTVLTARFSITSVTRNLPYIKDIINWYLRWIELFFFKHTLKPRYCSYQGGSVLTLRSCSLVDWRLWSSRQCVEHFHCCCEQKHLARHADKMLMWWSETDDECFTCDRFKVTHELHFWDDVCLSSVAVFQTKRVDRFRSNLLSLLFFYR